MPHDVFTAEEKKLLEEIGSTLLIQPMQIIYFQGDSANQLFYIRKGRVRVFQNTASGREVTLDVVGAGHIIGESAFSANGLRPACIQAVNEVQLVSFRTERLLPYFQTAPLLALHLLQQCSDTMDGLVRRLQEQCLLDRFGKVASFLLSLTAEGSSEMGTMDGMVPYSHEEIADSLGLNRATVTGVLRRFENNGWLQSGYRWVKVLNRSALEDFVRRQME